MKTIIILLTVLLAFDLLALTPDEVMKELSVSPPPIGIKTSGILETKTSIEINGEATSYKLIGQFIKNLNSSPRIKASFAVDNSRVMTVNDPKTKEIIEKFVIVSKK